MKDFEFKILNDAEKTCHNLEKQYLDYKDHSHRHMCDFDLIYKNYNIRKRKCKEYLKQFGMKRDFSMNCCNNCPHLRYVNLSKDGFILNVATLGLERDEIYNKLNIGL